MVKTKTPCLGICSTTSVGDMICRGCKRYAFEVIDWNKYNDDEKRAVLARIEKLNLQILENKLRIFSVPSLRLAMSRWNVPYDESLSPYCWLHNLLKKCHRELEQLDDYGVYVRPAFVHLSLAALCELIDQELILLSAAHHERYFESGTTALARSISSQ
ncbi:MAG: DUF1289 domain-containing protein [Pseudohongiellaceae bacterium]